MLAPPITHVDLHTFSDEKVNLKKDDADKHRAKVRDLRKRLEKYIKEHPDCGLVKMLLSGSLAKGTALSKLNDIDVAIYVKEDGAPTAVKDLAGWLAERLRKTYPQMSFDQIVVNEFSVTIKFMGAGLDVDIVPVYYAGLPDDKGHLVSRLTGELVLTSIPLHLKFICKRKNEQSKHFAQVVRLLKWWASELKEADASFRFKSFMIELICADLA
ncbi:MAG: nucleotidyltransferase, partial [Planctomycetes bacterium]|nr:nucleotidyltransferase [Planctomycetota bacterium]